MGMSICWKHRTTTAWGCRECLDERLSVVVAEAIEATKRDIEAAFKGCKPARVKLRK